MVANLIFLSFAVLLAWLLYRFPLQKAKTVEEYRKLFLFFCILVGFLAFNGFLAFVGMGGLKIASSSTPITELAKLKEIENQEGVLIFGEISDTNELIYGDYIAYSEESRLWSPKGLLIELKQGQVAISNDTYQAINWPIDILGYSYLKAGQPVTVVGYVENNIGLFGGEQTKSIRADLVYGGPYESFASRASFKQIIALGLLLANMVMAALIALIPVRECLREMKKG